MDKSFTYTNAAGSEFDVELRQHQKAEVAAGGGGGGGPVGWYWRWKYAASPKWVDPSRLPGLDAAATGDQAETAAKRVLDQLRDSGAARTKSRTPVDPPAAPPHT